MRDIYKFWEFSNAYFKKHVSFWIFGSILSFVIVSLIDTDLMIILTLGFLVFYFYSFFRQGWTDSKIRNLLLYKQLSKTELSNLEREVLENYFGRNERKEVILDMSVKNRWRRYVWLVDIGLVVSLAFSILGYMVFEGV